MEKYYSNFILCGEADFYCIVCNSLVFYEDLDKHIESDHHTVSKSHAKIIKSYKKNGIFQIDTFYYCKFCNCLVKKSKILRHTTQDRHKLLKKSKTPTREIQVEYKAGYYMFKTDSVLIKKSIWHGIIYGNCLLCNTKVNCLNEHIYGKDHILRLIRTYIRKESPKQYYRQMNEKLFQCFECNKLYPYSDLKIHFDSKKHMHNYIKFEQDSIKNVFKINKLRKIGDQIVDHGKRKAEASNYGKKHHITLNEGGTKAFCNLCAKVLPVQKSVFKCHVKGITHRSFLKLKDTDVPSVLPVLKYDYETVPSILGIMKKVTYLSDIKLIRINRSYLIPVSNFFMWKSVNLSKGNKKSLCLACNVLFPDGDESIHCTTTEHKKYFMVKVLRFSAEPDQHLLREVKPNCFHCCMCNELFPSWKILKKCALTCKNNYKKSKTILESYMGNTVKIEISHNKDIFYLDLIRAVFSQSFCLTLKY